MVTCIYTVTTTKSVHTKSLRFAIFWELFEKLSTKNTTNLEKSWNRYGFWTVWIDLVVGTVQVIGYSLNGHRLSVKGYLYMNIYMVLFA